MGLSLTATSSALAATKAQVLVTLNPIYLLAREIAGDEILVERLLPATSSAHDYALKVSDYKKLTQADLVIWVGPELESFLQKVTRNIASAQLLTLATLPQVQYPDSSHEGHESHHHHGDKDYHLWLDPDNVKIIVSAMSLRFGQVSPEHGEIFARRAEVLIKRMEKLDAEIAKSLAPVKDRPFVVYHPAYDHYVAHYSLNQRDYVSLTPEQKSGAKHLAKLQSAFQEDVVCLFTEPYQEHARVDAWAIKHGARQAELNPLGTDAMQVFDDLLLQLSKTIVRCLTGDDK